MSNHNDALLVPQPSDIMGIYFSISLTSIL